MAIPPPPIEDGGILAQIQLKPLFPTYKYYPSIAYCFFLLALRALAENVTG